MPESQGMHSAGTILYVRNYALWPWVVPAARPIGTDWDTVSPLGNQAKWQALPELIDCNGIDLKPTEVGVTHLRSDDTGKEKVPGFVDSNQLSCRFNYFKALQAALVNLVPGGANAPRQPFGAGGQTLAHWGRKLWALLLPDGGCWTFSAFLSGSPTQVPEDDRITLDLSLTISGVPRFTALA